jgi:hypothetical protein
MAQRKTSTAEQARGHIVHELPGRLRLRVANRRGNVEFFAGLLERLQSCLAVTDATANVATGSVLIQYDGEREQVLNALTAERYVVVGAPPQVLPLRQRALVGAFQLDQAVRQRTEGELDFGSLLGGFFIFLSLVQVARGRFSAPAVTLLWYALTMFGQGLLPAAATAPATTPEAPASTRTSPATKKKSAKAATRRSPRSRRSKNGE